MALLKFFNSARSMIRVGFNEGAKFDILRRNCHYSLTTNIPQGDEIPKYEICDDKKAWEYVERLLPCELVPDIPQKKYYASGWKPQKLHANMPYFIHRSKNHMLPVYLKISHRGMKRVTTIKKIYGDIYKLAKDIQNFLENVEGRIIGVNVLETCGRIDIHGDYVNNVKLWLERRNY